MGDSISLAVVELEADQGRTLEAVLKGRSPTNTVYDGVLMGSESKDYSSLASVVYTVFEGFHEGGELELLHGL